MATVAKSIIYTWPSLLFSTSGSSTVYSTASFDSKTLYFPETSSRVFRSVYAEISYHDNATISGGSLSNIKVELRISGSNNNSVYTGGSYSTAGLTTGENLSFVGGPFDFTSFFNTYVPSDSSSINIEAFSYINDTTGVSNVMLNPTFKLYCTYEHDDIDTTYIKTAIIPLESPLSNISTTFPGIIGNQQIPRLITSQSFSGFLPESNVNIRDYFIEIEGNELYGNNIDMSITGSITSSFTNIQNRFNYIERQLNSETYDRLIWNIPTSSLPNVSQSHNFGLRSNVTSFYHVPVNLYVTYEYNKTTTAQVNNTILLGWNQNSPLNYFIGTTPQNTNTNVGLNTFIIPENNPIIQQSALRIQWSEVDFQSGLFITLNKQDTSTQYSENSGLVNCGMKSLQHRFDISASNSNANTADVVLRKGLNYLTSSFYVNRSTGNVPTTVPSNVNGYYIINYKSDIHPTKGVDGCSRFYYFDNKQLSTSEVASTTFTSTDFSYNLSNSSSLYVVDSLYNYMSFERNTTTILDLGIQYTGSEAPLTPNNLIQNPKKSTYKNTITSDPEAGSFITTFSTQDIFKNYQTSPNPILMDPFVVRKYVSLFTQPSTAQVFTMFGSTSVLVAHSYTFDFTGSIYNYVGDGSGIPVTIYQAESTEAILQLTSSVGGKFSGTWFDDSTPIFASIDFGDKFGKSKLSIVTGSLDVYLVPFEYGYSNI